MEGKFLSNVGGTSVMDHPFECTKSCIRVTTVNAFSDAKMGWLLLVGLYENIIS